MGYYIDAWLENGIPQLSIRDVRTGAVRLRWKPSRGNKADHQPAGHDLQCLFRELVLLSCIDRIALPRHTGRSVEAECRECPGCGTDAGLPLPSPDGQARAEKVISLQDWRDRTHG